ncbi:MAG: hypothetical protein RMI45_08700 [Ignisphaera sp.]|nr:hypothetical protein [Ignisphaera sp.]
MVILPKTISYTDENKPDWIAVIKEDEEQSFLLEITIKSMNELEFRTSNVEGLLIDLQKAIISTGMTVTDAYAIIGFIRFTARNILLTVDGTGIDIYEIILPPGLSVTEVRKVTGEPIPFFFNMARNSVVFTVQFASPVTVEIIVSSITNLLNRTVQTITTIMIISSVFNYIVKEMREVIEEVRRRA